MALADDFESVDRATITRWIATRQEEHLTLEFKRVARPDLTDRNDQRNFAIALSGFANADGGLLVWGVGTSRRGSVEGAATEQPISDVATFLGRLNEFTGTLASPRVEGVRHRKIDSALCEGFAVSFIPSSDGGPHMAKAGINQYMRRHGDRFLTMEHYEIADMFGRRPRAKLIIEWLPLGGGMNATERYSRFQLKLKNIGRAAADAPFVSITINPDHGRVEPSGLTRITAMQEGLMRMAPMTDGSVACFGVRGLIIPPGLSFDVATVTFGFARGSGSGVAQGVTRDIHCRLAAENSPYEEQTIEIGSDVLARVL